MANYKVYGTNEPYSGNVVNINGDLFTTKGGTLEGDSKQVVKDTDTQVNPTNQTTDNPVIGTFIRGDRSKSDRTYYLPTNYVGNAGLGGRAVKRNTKLHIHADGTVMTEHAMGADDNSVVVTTSRPTNVGGMLSSNGNNRQMRTQPRTQTSTGGNTGGGTGGGSY